MKLRRLRFLVRPKEVSLSVQLTKTTRGQLPKDVASQIKLSKLQKANDREIIESYPDPAVTDATIEDAGQWLKRNGFDSFLKSSDRHEKIEWLSQQIQTRIKLSREQHLEAVVAAYAVFAMSYADNDVCEAVIALAKENGREVNGRTTRLRLIVELHVSYGTEEDDRTRAGRSHSRDVAAINTLVRRGVMPSQVMDLASKTGQGLDAWARASSIDQAPAPGSGECDLDLQQRTEKSRRKSVSDVHEVRQVKSATLRMPPTRHGFEWVIKHKWGEKTFRVDVFDEEAHDVLARCYNSLCDLRARSKYPQPTNDAVDSQPASDATKRRSKRSLASR